MKKQIFAYKRKLEINAQRVQIKFPSKQMWTPEKYNA